MEIPAWDDLRNSEKKYTRQTACHKKFTEFKERFKFHLKFQDYTEQKLNNRKGLVKLMKKKVAAILLSVILGVSLLDGCGNTDKGLKNNASQEQENEDAVYGEVSKITEDTITIKVGTMKAMEQPQGEAPEKPQGMSSMLDLTGEEQEIMITEDTTVKRQSMGGMGQVPGGGEMPEKPEGQQGAGNKQAPEKPDGEMPEKPEGQNPDMENSSEEITASDISEGDTVMVTFAEDGSAAEITVMSAMGSPGGMAPSSRPDSYVSVKEYNKDVQVEGESFTSDGTDENAILVSSGADAELENITVSRTSEDSIGGDSASFYGVGAAVLATDGNAYISDSTVKTDAAGGAGIFAYGSSSVYVADTTISTKQDTSGGIHAAGGGSLYAWDLEVETDGESSAAIRSDRGGGTMVVDGGTYVSNGIGSPAVYSTADIAINNATLTANGSEAVCIEGLNSLHLYNSSLSGCMQENEQNDCTWNVILYQSMSGDSEIGNSTFEMQGGTLKANHGGMFYTTNTESTISLSGVKIENADDTAFFLKCTGNQNKRGWGTAGINGADCLFTADNQTMEGDVVWDSISQLDFYMKENSSLTGAVVQDESCAGDGGGGYCNLYLGEGCTWTVTGDSVLYNLANEGVIVDEFGNTVTIQDSDGKIYIEGDSDYIITVETYSDSVDLSQAAQLAAWTEYQMAKPSQFN